MTLAIAFALPMTLRSAAARGDVAATIKFGCTTDGGVALTLAHPRSADQVTYLAGVAGPGVLGVPTTFADGTGPTLVPVGDDPVTVKLASSFDDGDHIYVQEGTDGSGAVATRSLAGCKRTNDTIPTLTPPKVAAQLAPAGSYCPTAVPAGTQIVSTTLLNFNAPGSAYRRATGLDSVLYTVLLVQADTQRLVDNGSLSFNSAGDVQAACLFAPAGVSATYEVRAISVDGGSTSATKGVQVTAPRATGRPSASPTPTPAASHAHPVTSPPRPKPVADSNPLAGGGSATVAGAPPVAAPPLGATSDRAHPSASAAASSSSPHAAPAGVTARPSPSGPTSASGEGSSFTKRLAEQPFGMTSQIFLWQSDAALIVLLQALAIGGLLGGVLWQAKRR
jgi:hypothetical protein